MGLLLGVDGGNTKTIAVVARRDGSVAGVGKSGLSDIHGAPTPSDGVGEIVRAVDAALAVAGVSVSDLDAATFSLAGVDWPEDFVYLRGELVRRLALGGEPAIVNDAVGAIRSGSPDWTGIAVVCGTGGAVGARNVRGDVFHYGFWPDGTGGGALGAQGLAAVWRADLGVGPETTLTGRALQRWGCSDPLELLHAFTRLDTPPIPVSEKSLFAEVVLDEAAVGDPVAVEIVRTAGTRLGDYGRLSAHRVALADGSVHELHRRSHEKNTVGFAVAHHPVDWFVGSEGTLGVVLEAELTLLPLPERVTGMWIPFGTLDDALALVIAARASALKPRCLEFFDGRAFPLVRDAADDPGWAPAAEAVVYLEDVSPVTPFDEWLALTELHHGTVDDIRVADTEPALREARRLRHAVPAAMNEAGAARRAFGGRKVSTDWAVPHELLGVALRHAADAVANHRAPLPVIYGHAGNGHPHQNFIAHDADELARVMLAVEETLHHVLALGGTVAAEHGIGKLKRKWLPLQATPIEIAVMRGLKNALDPRGLMAPGNVL